MAGLYISNFTYPLDKPQVILILNKGWLVEVVDENNTLLDECEAIYVPDHGDLIEREALKNDCKENAKRGIGLWIDYMDISLAPTIIEADKKIK